MCKKIPVVKDIFKASKTSIITLIFCACLFMWASSIIGSEQTGEARLEKMSVDGLLILHNNIENILLSKINKHKELSKDELNSIIEALGEIRSTKSNKILLELLEFSPFVNKGQRDTTESLLESGGKKLLYTGVYPAFYALIKIGNIKAEECITEIERSQSKSMRERLLIKIGFELYGKHFIEYMREKELKADGVSKKRWALILINCEIRDQTTKKDSTAEKNLAGEAAPPAPPAPPEKPADAPKKE